jgi:hypothetical protein
MADNLQHYTVPRESWVEGLFQILLEYIPGQIEAKYTSDVQYFSNDFFTIRPYCWQDEEEEFMMPNFEIPSENFKLDWYKYPFRNSYSSEKLTPRRWNDLIQKCIASLNNEN